jgi:DNA-binding IscR family transcriptional regulator
VLARTPQEITLKEIVEALEGGTFDIFCQPKIREEIICTHFPLCGIKPVWEKTKNVLDELYQGMTLSMVANNEIKSVSHV